MGWEPEGSVDVGADHSFVPRGGIEGAGAAAAWLPMVVAADGAETGAAAAAAAAEGEVEAG